MADSGEKEEELKSRARSMILRGYGDSRIVEETGLPEKTVKGVRGWLGSPKGKQYAAAKLEQKIQELGEEVQKLEDEKSHLEVDIEQLRTKLEMLTGFDTDEVGELRAMPTHELVRRSLERYSEEPKSLLLVEARGKEIANLGSATEGVLGYLGGPSGYTPSLSNEGKTVYGMFLFSKPLVEVLQRETPRAEKEVLDILVTKL